MLISHNMDQNFEDSKNLTLDTIKEGESSEIEALAFKAVKQIRKGFISALILAVLKEGEFHGYGIINEIKKKTQEIWNPTTSSVYPVLKDLESKKLVEFKDSEELEGKTRNIYKITEKGKRFFKSFVQKFQVLTSKLRTLTFGAFGFDGNIPIENVTKVMEALAEHPIFGWKNASSEEEKKSSLEYYKNLIDEQISYLQELKKNIEDEI